MLYSTLKNRSYEASPDADGIGLWRALLQRWIYEADGIVCRHPWNLKNGNFTENRLYSALKTYVGGVSRRR
ncbi:MAG: hypothetical protein B1H40_03215 [Candidatus Latescibacteria bacterium 4484_181]|nr:MAG: hypothetical protein B1H40_03215 [Candidatus Latescibacteria bacterium 4484_181]RKY68561.1 MAG: hypothetical protein DRQ02_03985 [Candidatus Latescibacterota bacterium]RKY72134.1 MAG: hypothetical protein DRQ24_05720 [Candidatus Latescibacterota bacterium]